MAFGDRCTDIMEGTTSSRGKWDSRRHPEKAGSGQELGFLSEAVTGDPPGSVLPVEASFCT